MIISLKGDPVVEEWLKGQKNRTRSLKTVIKAFVRQYGTEDVEDILTNNFFGNFSFTGGGTGPQLPKQEVEEKKVEEPKEVEEKVETEEEKQEEERSEEKPKKADSLLESLFS